MTSQGDGDGKLRIGLVGPCPPPFGGMANQTVQLNDLLQDDGIKTHLIQTNSPYKPGWIGRFTGIRAIFRLFRYALQLYRTTPKVDLYHVMANSGWSWHLFAAPAVWIAHWRKCPLIVNYRGGEAQRFFERSFRWVAPTLKRADLVVVPSGYLQEIFAAWGITTRVVPNIVNLQRFSEVAANARGDAPHLIVTRNLEPIYNIGTAIQAFALIKKSVPDAHLSIAGEGPESARLKQLVDELGLGECAVFTGRLAPPEMAKLCASAHVMLNPSRVDNMPNSVLEALASGVLVVSTNVGGVPHMVEHNTHALLVEPEDPPAMAQAACRVLDDHALASRLRQNGLATAQGYSWGSVRPMWYQAYDDVHRR